MAVTTRKGQAASPMETFTGSDVLPNLKDLHLFGSPVMVLKKELQAGKKIGKWDAKVVIGINLGPSPTHARSVSLVQSITTGLVSPQFHTKHDDQWELWNRKQLPKVQVEWMKKCHFHSTTGGNQPEAQAEGISRPIQQHPMTIEGVEASHHELPGPPVHIPEGAGDNEEAGPIGSEAGNVDVEDIEQPPVPPQDPRATRTSP